MAQLPRPMVQAYARVINDAQAAADRRARELVTSWLGSHPGAAPAEVREACIDIVTAVVDEYGNAASAAACDLYDETMLAEGLSLPAAEPIGETARADVEKAVRYQLRKWLDGDVGGFLEAMGGAAQYHVRRQANRTVIRNAERDDRSVTSTARDPRLGTYLPTASSGFGRSSGHVGRSKALRPGDIAYARVPTGAETCTYCMMLASRGFAYHTEESAGHADHRGCNCLIVAGLHGSTTVEGVDVREQYRTWRAMATADAKHDAGELSDEEWQARKRAIVDAHPRATAGIPAAPSKAGGNTGERVDWYVPEDYDKIAELRASQERAYGVRYGIDSINADVSFVDSNSYRSMFEGLTGNPELDAGLYEKAVDGIKKNAGTRHESMHFFDADTGAYLHGVDCDIDDAVYYTEEMRSDVEKCRSGSVNISAIHVHTDGTPPSGDDFRKAYENRYSRSYVAGQNGRIYSYENNSVELTTQDCDQIAEDIGFLYRSGYDVDRAYETVLGEYGLSFRIEGTFDEGVS